MRTTGTLFFLLFSIFSCQEQASPKKAVFVIVDGIPADVIERIATPNLDAIAGEKGYSRAYVGGLRGTYNETPTISAPGYMSLLTGTWANKHNVVNNYNQEPNYHFRNVFRIVEEYNSTLQTAVFSTWQDNRTVLIGDGVRQGGNFAIDYAFDGFELDTLRFPHDPERDYIRRIDEMVAGEAGSYIAANGPDLSWVYLEFPDDVGHSQGDSEAFEKAVQQADIQIGQIWDGVKHRISMGEDWLMVVTTDHGRDSLTGRGHGGQSDRERQTWMVTNAADLNDRFIKGQPAITDIAPTLLRHLELAVPWPVAVEFDGIPFIGKVSFDRLEAALDGRDLRVRWQPLAKTGRAKLYASFRNAAKAGLPEAYELLSEVGIKEGGIVISLTDAQLQQFYNNGLVKVLLEGEHNMGNVWVLGR